MNLSISQFTNNNHNYEPVNFVVNDGWMKIYDKLTVDVNSTTDETCAGEVNGSATLLVTGGQPGSPRYSYSVFGVNTHTGSSGSTDDNISLSSLRPDTYHAPVYAKDDVWRTCGRRNLRSGFNHCSRSSFDAKPRRADLSHGNTFVFRFRH